jgi:hypothetical protein
LLDLVSYGVFGEVRRYTYITHLEVTIRRREKEQVRPFLVELYVCDNFGEFFNVRRSEINDLIGNLGVF